MKGVQHQLKLMKTIRYKLKGTKTTTFKLTNLLILSDSF